MCGPHSRRPAFTLVELLVVIAIIGILIALLLPAVQAAREAARRSDCTNKLKQLVLATHNHHDTYQTLPRNYDPNAYGYDNNGRGWSWIAQTLPFLEQRALYDSTGIAQTPDPDTFANRATAFGTPLKAVQCPSDNTIGDGTATGGRANVSIRVGLTSYKGVCGSNWGWGSFQNTGPSGNNNGLDAGDGIFSRNDGGTKPSPKRRNFADITDGLSNTYMIGEDLSGLNQHCSWPHSNHATGTCAIPLNNGLVAGQPGYNSPGSWDNLYSFRSRHPGGGQFAMADGSARFVSETIDLTVYRQLATRSGGEAVSNP